MKTGAFNDFWQGIHADADTRHLPLRVMFELTYKCNFHCRHCYVPKSWRRRKELNTKEILGIIKQLKTAGCFYLGFTGGEIFMRPDIWKILEFSRKQGMQIILYTNGFLVDKKNARLIAGIGVNKVDITLPGISEKVFDGVTGVNGSHKRVFSAIDFLRRNKIDLGFKTCLLKANHGEIKAIEAFCAGIKAPHRLDDAPVPPIDRLMADQAKPTKLFKCGSGIAQCAITPQGQVKLCPLVDWPKIKISQNQKFYQIWEKLPEMIKAGKCRRPCPCTLGRLTEELCAIQ
jgi:MoaA/NifB/PqqE/SkfB family radical SAM enzyme